MGRGASCPLACCSLEGEIQGLLLRPGSVPQDWVPVPQWATPGDCHSLGFQRGAALTPGEPALDTGEDSGPAENVASKNSFPLDTVNRTEQHLFKVSEPAVMAQ